MPVKDRYERWKGQQLDEWLYVLLHPKGDCEETCNVCHPELDWGGYFHVPYDPTGCNAPITDWYEQLLDEEVTERGWQDVLIDHLRTTV